MIKWIKPQSTQECLEFIYGIAMDYDGYNTVEGLKGLIDEMSNLAKDAI